MEQLILFIQHICQTKNYDIQQITEHLDIDLEFENIPEIDDYDYIGDTMQIYLQTSDRLKFHKEIKVF